MIKIFMNETVAKYPIRLSNKITRPIGKVWNQEKALKIDNYK